MKIKFINNNHVLSLQNINRQKLAAVSYLVSAILFLSIFGSTARAENLLVPAWFAKDIARKAKWLPKEIKDLGYLAAYQKRWAALPVESQNSLNQMNIPAWMIALIPSDQKIQGEINKQFRMMTSLAGTAAQGPLAQRAEQLLIFGGSAQLPTPGDKNSGVSLAAEGCTAAMSKYVLAQLKVEFPEELESMPDSLTVSQSSSEMKSIFSELARKNATWFDLKRYPFEKLVAANVYPGSLMIGQKPGGTHVFGWTRVASVWGWSTTAKMAIGNTGLPQYGSRMILAQEYITDDPSEYGDAKHNEHGPINSKNVIYSYGYPVLEDPRTNVYAAQGSQFVIINLH